MPEFTRNFSGKFHAISAKYYSRGSGFYSTPPEKNASVDLLATELAKRGLLLRKFLGRELIRQQGEHQQGWPSWLIFWVSSALTLAEFADAFAQTLRYGLFMAKLNIGARQARTKAANGFLR